jgi:hypothetical protein
MEDAVVSPVFTAFFTFPQVELCDSFLEFSTSGQVEELSEINLNVSSLTATEHVAG